MTLRPAGVRRLGHACAELVLDAGPIEQRELVQVGKIDCFHGWLDGADWWNSSPQAPRVTLRRQVTTAAASANSEQEFYARLDQAAVLVRKRFSVKNPGQVTGYSVALPGDTTKDGGPIWYGG